MQFNVSQRFYVLILVIREMCRARTLETPVVRNSPGLTVEMLDEILNEMPVEKLDETLDLYISSSNISVVLVDMSATIGKAMTTNPTNSRGHTL